MNGTSSLETVSVGAKVGKHQSLEPRAAAPEPSLPGASLALLVGMLTIDLALHVGHLLYFVTDWHEPRLLLSYEGGYGELFQYAKFFGLAAVFLLCTITTGQLRWLSWAFLFTYLGLDDSMELHESLARTMRNSMGLVGEGPDAIRWGGLRAQDWFEIGSMGLTGAVLLSIIALAWGTADERFRRISRRVICGLLLLGVVGVGMDIVHEHTWVRQIRWLHHTVGILEDGGEMIATTLIVWAVAFSLIESRSSLRPLPVR